MKNYIQHGPFAGVVTSLDPEMIPENAAADLRNVTVEDGRITPRYGYRTLGSGSAPGDLTAAYGFDYVQGFNGSNALVEEYISIEKRSSAHSPYGSNAVVPYSVNVSSGARTLLTNSGSAVTFTAPTYGDQPGIRALSFNDNAYIVSPADTPTLYKHAIGAANSLVPMQPPAAPTKAPVVVFEQYSVDQAAGSTTVSAGANSATQSLTSVSGFAPGQCVYFATANAYRFVTAVGVSSITVNAAVNSTTSEKVKVQLGVLRWDDGTAVASSALSFVTPGGDLEAGFLPSGTTATDGNGNITLLHDGNGSVTSPSVETVTMNLTSTHAPGQQDFTYVDRILVIIGSTQIGFSGGDFNVTLTNASGEVFQALVNDQHLSGVIDGPGATWSLVCDFPFKDPRSDWSTIQSITIGWTVTGNANSGAGGFPNQITISPLRLGQVNTAPLTDDGSGNQVNLLVGYTYYNSTTGLESQISPVLVVTPAQLQGPLYTNPLTGAQFGLFSRPKLFLTADSGSDSYRIYARRPTDDDWFLVYDPGLTATSPAGLVLAGATGAGGTQKTLAGVTYDASANIRLNWNELSLSSIFALGGSVFSNLISACAYKGWMVWGFRGGFANLQHSQIGNELVLFNNSDLTQLTPSNTSAPANFTLADNGSDDPVAMFPVDQSLIILGQHGVYAQSGYSPTTMSPPYKLPTALGCCGQYACCLWHDDIGNPGVAFVSKNGEGVYMAQQDLYYLNETHYKIVELTSSVRGALMSFLVGAGSLANVRMWVDHTRDSLWVACGANVMVLRRPSMVDQMRHWEFYTYTFSDSSTIGFVGSDTRNRVRWMRASGAVDENEWNSNSSAWISGALSDGGNALTPLYYQCRKVTNPERTRVRFVRVDRASLTDTPSVTIASTRLTATVACVSGSLNVRFGALQQGKEHQVKISPADGSGAISRVLVEVEGPLGDRWFE